MRQLSSHVEDRKLEKMASTLSRLVSSMSIQQQQQRQRGGGHNRLINLLTDSRESLPSPQSGDGRSSSVSVSGGGDEDEGEVDDATVMETFSNTMTSKLRESLVQIFQKYDVCTCHVCDSLCVYMCVWLCIVMIVIFVFDDEHIDNEYYLTLHHTCS